MTVKTVAASSRFADSTSSSTLAEESHATPARMAQRSTHNHIPALDGIRGLAVLLVLYNHMTLIDPVGGVGRIFLASARLSWSGVDLFFVLSGFLITGILFDSKSDTHYFRNFYARRTVRIFPLYYAFLIFALLIVPAVPALLRTFEPAPHPGVWYWLYLSNFSQPFHAGQPNDIVHVSWTLAIEEQFYLCWPLVVFLFDRKTLMRICIAGFFGSLIIRSGMVVANVRESIVGGFTFCRFDGLLTGAWIALMIRPSLSAQAGGWQTRTIAALRQPARVTAIGSAVLLAAIVIGSYAFGWRAGIGQSPAYSIAGFSVLATLYGSLLVLAVSATPGSRMHRAFTGKFLTTFGKFSYAIYLLHWPVTIVVRDYLFDPRGGHSNLALLGRQFAFYGLTTAIALIVAWLSWHLFEKHFLALKKWFPTRHQTPAVAR